MDDSRALEKPLLGGPVISWEEGDEANRPHYRRSRAHLYSWCAQLLLFGVSVTTLFYASRLHQTSERCVDKLSIPSPALAAVDDSYHLQRFEGHVTGDPSGLKGPPTPERLAAWGKFLGWPHIQVDSETLLRAGASEDSVRTDDGSQYVVGLEVYHQVHCLKELWMSSWPDSYHPNASDPHSLYRRHLDHCVDILRQKLVCEADVGLVALNWVEHLSHPTPNFNVLHKCRDFDAIDDWVRQREVGLPQHRPVDAVRLKDFP